LLNKKKLEGEEGGKVEFIGARNRMKENLKEEVGGEARERETTNQISG